MPRTIVKSLKVLAWIVGALALISAVLAIVVSETDSGRRWVADRIEQFVSDNIPGSLHIGRVLDLGPPLIAEDVRFYHPDGRIVLLAKRAEVVASLAAALEGKLAFERVAVNGGRIVLSPDPDGRVAFEAAVDEPTKPGEPNDPTGGLHYNLQSMHVENFDVIFALNDSFKYSLRDVEGFVEVRRIETAGVRIKLESIDGRLEPELLGNKTELQGVNGQVYGKHQHVLHLDLHMSIGSGKLEAALDYYDRQKAPVMVKVRRSKGNGELLAGLLNLADPILGDTLEVEVED